jgi:phosphate transport system protein
MTEARRSYHQELDDIHEEMTRIAALLVETVPKATQVLLDSELQGADDLIHGDDVFNARCFDLEQRCYAVLALQQPVAADLRRIIAAMKVGSEVERSADLCANVAKAARRLYGHDLDPKLRGLVTQMSDQAQQLMRFAVDAYAANDAPLAAALDDIDDLLDRLQVAFIAAIFESHSAGRTDLAAAVQLALIARFYERIGDHAVNIGEWVQYAATGQLPHPEPKAVGRFDGPGEVGGAAEAGGG